MLFVVILVLGLHTLCAHSNQDVPKWNRLRVTARKMKAPSALPLTEQEAKQNKWSLIADDCKDGSSPFKGRRYMLNNDPSTIPIFDVNGNVAGLQMAYDAKHQLIATNSPAYMKIGKNIHMTAYFTSPENICDGDGASRRKVGAVGDKLVLVMGRDKYMDIPLYQKQMEKQIEGSSKWKLGECFPGMGTHFWYGISNGMDCADVSPFFLLYNKGVLGGWGFTTIADISSPRVEHPPKRALKFFFKEETMPRCIKKVKQRTTQHVYFTDVTYVSHICPGFKFFG